MYSSIRNTSSSSSPSTSILDVAVAGSAGASKSARIELASCNVKTAEVVRWKFRDNESSFEAVDSQFDEMAEQEEIAAAETMLMLEDSAVAEEVAEEEAAENWLSIFNFNQLTAHCHFSESKINFSLTLEDLLAAATKVLIHW